MKNYFLLESAHGQVVLFDFYWLPPLCFSPQSRRTFSVFTFLCGTDEAELMNLIELSEPSAWMFWRAICREEKTHFMDLEN